jgi:hypothetical protein
MRTVNKIKVFDDVWAVFYLAEMRVNHIHIVKIMWQVSTTNEELMFPRGSGMRYTVGL